MELSHEEKKLIEKALTDYEVDLYIEVAELSVDSPAWKKITKIIAKISKILAKL